jgi:hypothetical protein
MPDDQGTTPTTTPVITPAPIAASSPARTTTSHCARLTTGDRTWVNGEAKAGTPEVKDGIRRANEEVGLDRSWDGVGVIECKF